MCAKDHLKFTRLSSNRDIQNMLIDTRFVTFEHVLRVDRFVPLQKIYIWVFYGIDGSYMISQETSNRASKDRQLERLKHLTVSAMIFLLALSSISHAMANDYLKPGDFNEESWSKQIDYLEYVDVYAAAHGLPRPPAAAHAYLYMTYVNYSGVQMLYAGLSNITMGLGAVSVTLPLQTCMVHYKTEDQQRNVVAASSYMMLLAYNETVNTMFPNSPDRNDTLFASFSMGYDLSSIISTDAPALNSKTSIIQLTRPDTNRWHWGMTYTNLTAIWWRVWMHGDNSSYHTVPVAVTVYEELTFTYDLIFDLQNNRTQIVSNYVIGRMTDLWVVDTWWWFTPVIVHYDSTGCYRLNKTRYSDETIHQFIERQGISMSAVFFQASALLDHGTESEVDGQDATETEMLVSDDTIATYSDDGEKLNDIDFSAKDQYILYNCTSGMSESHNAITRTAERRGFAENPVFAIHTFLMRYIPLALVHMDQSLYEQAKNKLLNMTYADYFYIISYPTYSGYRIEHDPLFTAYVAPATSAAGPGIAGIVSFLIAVTIVAVSAIGIILALRKRRTRVSSPAN